MKRHESLAPLSRDHHGSLILARLLRNDAPAYKGLPQDAEGKKAYALELFSKDIKAHFLKEESLLKMLRHYPSIEAMEREIKEEHINLEAKFNALNTARTVSADELDKLGRELESHIRKEERVLFPLIQDTCTSIELNQVKDLF